jgi:hypothetical protein
LEQRGGPSGALTQSAEDEHNTYMLYYDYVSLFHLTQKEWKGSFCNKLRRIGTLGALGGNLGSQDHQLCFVDIVINKRIVQDMVDLGALHKFMKTEVERN